MIHIRMAVHGLAQALMHACGQPNGIDDARVIQFIGNDGVSRSAQRREQRLGCRPTRNKRVTGLKAKKGSDALLKFMVGGEGPANEPDGCRTATVSIQSFMAGLDHAGFIGKPEVIVGTKAQNPAVSLKRDFWVHRTFDGL